MLIFILAIVLLVGSILVLLNLGIFFSPFAIFINPYLAISAIACFGIGLILIAYSGYTLSKSEKSIEIKKNTRFLRWYIASPFLYVLFFEIIGLVHLLISGEDIRKQSQDLLFSLIICGLLLWPEITKLLRSIVRWLMSLAP